VQLSVQVKVRLSAQLPAGHTARQKLVWLSAKVYFLIPLKSTPKKQVLRHSLVSLSPKDPSGHLLTQVLVELSPYVLGLKGQVKTQFFVLSSA
jgi:hypothetical protein